MKGRSISIALAAGAVLVSGLPAAAQMRPAPSTTTTVPVQVAPLSPTEEQFLLNLSRENDHELRLAEMARDKAQRNEVRDLATRLAQDHTKLSFELRQFAANRGVKLSNAPSGQPEPQLELMSKLSPMQFEEEFVKAMVQHHEKDVAQFRMMSQQAQDPELRSWTAKMLPTLEEHLRMAKQVQSRLIGSAR